MDVGQSYEKIILMLLLDKYEKSRSFTGDNKVNQSFSADIIKLFQHMQMIPILTPL